MNPAVNWVMVIFLLLSSTSIWGRSLETDLSPHFKHSPKEVGDLILDETGDSSTHEMKLLTKDVMGSVSISNNTYFKCNEKSGIFLVPGPYRDLYICPSEGKEKTDGNTFTYICPDGMVFNKKIHICVVSSLAAMSDECKIVRHRLVKRDSNVSSSVDPIFRQRNESLDISQNSTIFCQREVNAIVTEASALHTHISNIDKYIDHIKRTDPQDVPSIQKEKYLDVLRDYNMDLENAKNNAKMWRNKDGIFHTIKEILLLAKVFDQKFTIRFEAYLQRVGLIVTEDGMVTSSSAKFIEDSKETILKFKNEPVIRRYIEKKIKEFQKAYDDLAGKYEIPKILMFLKFVLNDFEEILNKVEQTERKTSSLEMMFTDDYNNFQRHLNIVHSHMEQLQKDKTRNQREGDTLKGDIISLINRKELSKKQLARVERREEDVSKKLQNLRRTKRSPVHPAIVVSAAFIGGVPGEWLRSRMVSSVNNHEEQLLSVIANYQREIVSLQSQIYYIEQDISNYEERLHVVQNHSELLDNNFLQFDQLQGSFETMRKEIHPIIGLLKKAKAGISKIKGIFQDQSSHLKILIKEAMNAKSAIKQMNFRYFIYNEITFMKCLWNEVSYSLSSFDGIY